MNDHNLRGPALTYVTDEQQDRATQERVLREFIGCAGAHPLRVAFRLPKWSDQDVLSLLHWYTDLVERMQLHDQLEPPLVHDRPEAVDAYPGSRLWLPWRNRDLVRDTDIGRFTMSVHSLQEAHEAVCHGASELVFGHVFASESHPNMPGRGVSALQEMAESIRSYQNPPLLTAIGGINEHTISDIGRYQHRRVAAIRSISQSEDISATLDQVRSTWLAGSIVAELDERQRTPFGRPSSIFF